MNVTPAVTKTLPHVDATAIVGAVNAAGFTAGLAIATDAEVAAGAACGQMALLVEDLEAIKKELEGYGTDALWGDVPEDFVEKHHSVWEDEGKHQLASVVYEHVPTGTYWMACGSRYGDHWSGYEVSLDSVEQVKPVEKTVTVWEGV